MWQKYKRNRGISIYKFFYGAKLNNDTNFGIKKYNEIKCKKQVISRYLKYHSLYKWNYRKNQKK